MRRNLFFLIVIVLSAHLKAQTFEPNWSSLTQYTVPLWYQNAKFGIFIHWGVYSVPAYDSEWYPRQMYMEGSEVYQYHLKAYGPQSDFGYKDFIKMFKAEKWDPQAWADLFVKAGAKFVVPVAEHHDGFPMYACSYTNWDAFDMGPQRDVIGELANAVRKRGLKFGVSSHRAFNWSYYARGDSYDTNNPFFWGLYGIAHKGPDGTTEETHGFDYLRTSDAFLTDWYARTSELVDKYQPDLIWFDWVINREEFEPWLQKFAAYYYNKAIEWNKGVVINYKYAAFAEGTAVLDVERGKLSDIGKMTWQTDTSVGKKSWGYIKDEEYKSADELIDQLVDIVSKNGILLLNIGPKSDGSIPEQVEKILLEIGNWLQINGKAIYGTRPWSIYGEGPTVQLDGAHQESKNIPYTAQDVRYLAGVGDSRTPLYAVALEWPENEFHFPALKLDSVNITKKIKKVRLLGCTETLEWSQSEAGLVINLPSMKPCRYAYCFEIF